MHKLQTNSVVGDGNDHYEFEENPLIQIDVNNGKLNIRGATSGIIGAKAVVIILSGTGMGRQ